MPMTAQERCDRARALSTFLHIRGAIGSRPCAACVAWAREQRALRTKQQDAMAQARRMAETPLARTARAMAKKGTRR